MSGTEEAQQYQLVPMDRLAESANNPRQHQDAKKLEDLVESVRQHGVLEPILARPVGSAFEIVAGWRRYKAAQAAGLTHLPAIVRAMDDRSALEIQNIENLQREDVHPLDEAHSYRRLIESAGYTPQALSGRLNKPVSYIIQRLKLTDLIPAVQKLLLAGTLTPGHGFALARLQPAQQAEVLKWAVRGDETLTVAGLERHIREEVLLDLHSAPWKKDDAALYPAAGPCTTCPKRTGNAPELFPGLKGDTCTDPGCFAIKYARFIDTRIEELTQREHRAPLRLSGESDYEQPQKKRGIVYAKAWTKAKPGECEYARTGVVTEEGRWGGRSVGRGTVLTVCAEPKCKRHFPGPMCPYVPRITAQEAAANKRERTKRRVEAQTRQVLFERVLEKVELPEVLGQGMALTVPDARVVAREFFDRVFYQGRRLICQRLGLQPIKRQYSQDWETPVQRAIEKMAAQDLGKFLLSLALSGDLSIPSYGMDRPDTLEAVAKRYGVDPTKVREQIQTELRAGKHKKTVQEWALTPTGKIRRQAPARKAANGKRR